MNDPIAFSLQDAAKQIGVSANHLRDLIAKGEIAAVRRGRMIRVERAALLAFLDKHRLPTGGARQA